MIFIDVPNSSNAEQELSLGGELYRFIFKFNSRLDKWVLNIFLGEVEVISGVHIVPNQDILGGYILDNWRHGQLFCLRQKETSRPLSRNNFGVDKDYILVYMSNEELGIE